MSKLIQVGLKERSYKIDIGKNTVKKIKTYFKKLKLTGKFLIVSNEKIAKLHLDYLLEQLTGYEILTLLLPDGEYTKSNKFLNKIYDFLAKNKFNRSDNIIAFGGGVVGDLAGYAAATYMRGMNFVQIPTTLLSQVDSSVGGKTGINHKTGKNLIGAFYQPKLVLIDTCFLSTLNKKEFAAGFAEVIKYGYIYDKNLYKYILKNIKLIYALKDCQLEHIIARSCSIKAMIVEKDETESNLRMILNFGHTIGHAIENAAGYSGYRHGEAVAIGMVGALIISNKLGFTEYKLIYELKKFLKQSKLPLRIKEKFSTNKLVDIILNDKKIRNKNINFIVIESVGKAKIIQVEKDILMETINILKK